MPNIFIPDIYNFKCTDLFLFIRQTFPDGTYKLF